MEVDVRRGSSVGTGGGLLAATLAATNIIEKNTVTVSSHFKKRVFTKHLLGTTIRNSGSTPAPLSDREVIGFLFADFYE